MSSKRDFQIGKIVYVLSEKNNTVIPGIVIEKVVVESLNGCSTSWKIRFGSEKNNKIVDTSDFKQDIYLSLDELANMLRGNFNNFIEELIQTTNAKTKDWYGKTGTESVIQKPSKQNDSLEDYFETNPEPVNKESTLKDRLRQMVTATDDEIMDS